MRTPDEIDYLPYISVRTCNALKRKGLTSIKTLSAYSEKEIDELRHTVIGVGTKGVNEIKRSLSAIAEAAEDSPFY